MKSKELKKLLNSNETLLMPDAYDSISAKLIEKAGFKAIQCSGYSFSVAAGYKRETDISLDENVEWTRRIIESVNIPVMADAEDGYGDPEEVVNTVKRFIDVGVAGLNIEDQIHNGKSRLSIVDEDIMIQKIINARETAENKYINNFIINGRTDALRSIEDRDEGLKIAIDRANQYIQAGADIAFIPYIETLDEVKKVTKKVKGPVSIAAGMPYNINNFTIEDLKQSGVSRISFPTLLILSSLQSIKRSLEYLKEDKISEFLDNGNLYSIEEVMKLLG